MKLKDFDAALTDLFEVDDFWHEVQQGLYMDEDGQGYYGTPTHFDLDAPARPSDIKRGLVGNNGYGYVHWFNK